MKKLYSLMVAAGAPFRATAPQLKGTFKMKSKSLILLVIVALAGFLPQSKAALTVNLGAAANFAILGGSAVTFTAPMNTVTGDVGVATGTSITGIPANLSQTGGTIHINDSLANAAQLASTAAFLDAKGRTPFTTLAGGDNQLGGQNLVPGVYTFAHASSFNLIGTLTLNAQNDPNAVWIFQAPSDLSTASGSTVNLINGADACNVFWQVTSSATLGSGSSFDGTILALTSITLGAGVTVDGRLLAQNGLVSLINDTINNTCVAVVPEPSSFWPLAFFTSVFGAWQWLAMWRRKAGCS
jgi:Ice-binding-like